MQNTNKSSLIKYLRSTTNSYNNDNNDNLNINNRVSAVSNDTFRNETNLFKITKKEIDMNGALNSGNDKRSNSPLYRLAVHALKSKVVLSKDKDKVKKDNQTNIHSSTHLTKLPLARSNNNNNFSHCLSNLITSSNSLNNVLMIGNNIRVGRKIGNGNFGEIRLGKNLTNSEDLAIKFEKSNDKINLLINEFKFYKILMPHEGIPNVYNYNESLNYNSLVMELLGPSLEELFNLCNRVFSLKTICMIAIQVLRRIEYVHSKNIVYRDIKPENFLIGRQSTRKDHIIHLIDFGLAKEFVNSDTGKHIPYSENKNLTGTARYMSVNTHLGREQSRRDDLEAIAHMLLYFLRGSLPWQGLKVDNIKERYKKIAEIKQSTKIEDLCKDLPMQFTNFLNYSRKLEFDEKPDYQSQIRSFQDLMKSKGWWPINWKFDWSDHYLKISKIYSNTNKITSNNNTTTNINNRKPINHKTLNTTNITKIPYLSKNNFNKTSSVSKLTNSNSQENNNIINNNNFVTVFAANTSTTFVKNNQLIQSRITHLTNHFDSSNQE